MILIINLLITIFFVQNILTSENHKNLPPFAQDWIRTVAASQVDLAEIAQVNKINTADETYIATLYDKTDIIATKSPNTGRISCTRSTHKGSIILLEDKYFDTIRQMYLIHLSKK